MKQGNAETKTDIVLGMALLGALLMTVVAFRDYLNMPIVYVSNSTGQCAWVETPQGVLPCDPLPPKYSIVYVE